MDTATTTRPVAVVREPTRLGTLLELTKPRLSGLVVVTTGMGYLIASAGSVDWWRLLSTLAGTALLAGGASAVNMWLEVGPDSLMLRTRDRPLPSRRLGRVAALSFALAITAIGLAVLARTAGALTAALGLSTWLIYVGLYTPLKRLTTLCTLVGAVVGAIPPVMGWTAVTGRIESGAIVLGAILFVWQIPHFLAIAWLYREDYARSGFKMLPVVDGSGRSTFVMVLLYSAALVPVTLLAATIRPTGWLYPVGALVLGLGFSLLAIRLYRDRTREAARRLFLASLVYLPLVFLLLVFDPTGPKP